MKSIAAFLSMLAIAVASSLIANAQSAKLVKDMPGTPGDLVEFRGLLYFFNHSPSDFELWKSDGTAWNTKLVKHFSIPSAPAGNPEVWDNNLYFFREHELWKSDGTTGGTARLKNYSSALYLEDLTPADDKFYFRVTSVSGPNELWKSNGTAAGTVKVTDIPRLVTDESDNDLPEFTYSNGLLFFWASTPAAGAELWKSDGTAAGTALVKDINPGPSTSKRSFTSLSYIVNFRDKVYFAADDGISGIELWTSDGTEAGTVLVKDVAPGSLPSYPMFMTVVNNTLFFSARDERNGQELWTTDGTAQRTEMINGIGASGSFPSELTAVGRYLYFTEVHGASSRELYRTVGFSKQYVGDINSSKRGTSPAHIVGLNGLVFFSAFQPASGREFWQSDGESISKQTYRQDILPGATGSNPQNITAAGSRIFFTANDGIHGEKLWVYEPMFETISNFVLVNAETDEDLINRFEGTMTIYDRMNINLQDLPTHKLNIRAVTNLSPGGSVAFERNGVLVRMENSAPYAMNGDEPAGDYLTWTPAVGEYEVCATLYSGQGGTGRKGFPFCRRFTIENNPVPKVVSFTLVNADTDEDIQLIQQDDVIDLATLPTTNLNIRANTNPPVVGNVSFFYNEISDDVTNIDDTAPYTVFGDNNGDYLAGNIVPCEVCWLHAYAYIENAGDDFVGTGITFSIINSTSSKMSESEEMETELNAGELQLYPNPNQGVFEISYSSETITDLSVEIFDLFGKSVFREELLSFSGAYQRQLDLSIYPQGVYLLRVDDGEAISVKKVVIE